jgi:hypothetical protein
MQRPLYGNGLKALDVAQEQRPLYGNNLGCFSALFMAIILDVLAPSLWQ